MTTRVIPSEFTLSIAGLAVRLRAHHPDLITIVNQRYSMFAAADASAIMVCDLIWEQSNDEQVNSDLSIVYRPDGILFSGPAIQGAINVKEGQAVLNCDTRQIEGALEYFLRLVYTLLVFESGGLILHGAGVLRAGLAVIFFGHSGSGKTTVARLSEGSGVLNDDLVCVFPSETGWQVAATPFWNPSQVTPTACQAPLGGLFRLVQDSRVFLLPASPAVALAELISAIPVINADPRRAPVILERLAKLNQACQVQFLHFLPDDSFWKVIDPLLRNGL